MSNIFFKHSNVNQKLPVDSRNCFAMSHLETMPKNLKLVRKVRRVIQFVELINFRASASL